MTHLCLHERIDRREIWKGTTLIERKERCLDCGATRTVVQCPTCGTHVDQEQLDDA